MPEVWTMGEMLVEIMRPETGMTLYETGQFTGPFPSGAPAIFIDAAARLGQRAGIIGGVGNDDFGKCLVDRLKADNANIQYVDVINNRSTAVAFVTYFADGSRQFIFHIDGTPAVAAKFPEKALEDASGFFHVMGCSLMINKSFQAQIFKAVQAFAERGAEISFDPNIRSELLYSRDINDIVGPVMEKCSVLLPGEQEILLLTGEKTCAEAVDKLFQNPVLKTIVLKKGRNGATVYTKKEVINIPPYAVTEVDPTGSGDCFDAGFLCGLLEGKSLGESGKIAAAAGALNAASFGPMGGMFDRKSIDELITGRSG
jgi:sugar/nucleoside kinase (ribokinase family)